MQSDQDKHEQEENAKRRGERKDTRRYSDGKMVAPSGVNRRMRRAHAKRMRGPEGEKMRRAQAEIDRKTAEVRQRIADGESLDSIREELRAR